MFNFLGVSSNLSVLAGTRWLSTFRFVDGTTGQDAELDGVTFTGKVHCAGVDVSMELTISEADEERNQVRVVIPALPEGRWEYEIWVTSDTGQKVRLMEGRISALGKLEADDAKGAYALRTLDVLLPGDASKHVQLEWQATTLAQAAAQDAINAAQGVKEIDTNVKEALQKANDALDMLGDVDDRLDAADEVRSDCLEAKEGAEAARDEAERLIEEAPREFIPTISADGYWVLNGVKQPHKAIGEDGVDGTRVVKHLVDDVEDIPTSGETCNSGHVYYVNVPEVIETLESRPADLGNWNAWRLSADVVPHGVLLSALVVLGAQNSSTTPLYVAVYLREQNATRGLLSRSVSAQTWNAGQDVIWEFEEPVEVPAGYGIEIYLAESLSAIGTNSAARPSVQMRSYILSGGSCSCRYDASWYGSRTPYLGFLSPYAGKVMAYEWFDGRGWMCLAGNGANAQRPASATEDGLVKLGTELRIDMGAPVGNNAAGQLTVGLASTVCSGTIMLSYDGVIEDGIRIGLDSSGRVVAEGSKVAPATLTTLGTVKLGSEWSVLNPIPYQQGVAAGPQKQLCNNLRNAGALKNMQKAGWKAAEGNARVSAGMNDRDYYLGLHVSSQFSQSEEAGLVLREASTERCGGVTLTVNPNETAEAHVLDASALRQYYARKADVTNTLQNYIRTNETLMGIKVMTQEEYDKMDVIDAHTLYLVY